MTKEEKIIYQREWRKKNKDKVKKYLSSEYQKKSCKNWRITNAPKVKENFNAWYDKNKSRYSIYRQKNRNKINDRQRQFRVSNKEKTKEYYKKQLFLSVTELRSSYCRSLLKSKGVKLITPELIEAQRLILKIKRITKNHEKENKNSIFRLGAVSPNL